jgi:mannitol/fructose-specific phosphotransferase system IIA component (Ntr-type)
MTVPFIAARGGPSSKRDRSSTLSRFDAMLIAKHLRHDRIRLEMETEPLTTDELEEFGPRATRVLQERVFQEIAEFLDQTARVGNATRLRKDLFDREKKAGTAMGGGLAMPHVRTMNVKDPTIAFLRSTPGLDFGAPDHLPVHVFLVLVAPPWDDRLYLKIYREAGTIFLRDDTLPNLLGARNTNDVFNFFRACDLAAD